jgi:fumarate reductase subunit C
MNTQLMHFQLTLSYSLLCLISEEGNICLVNILYSKSTLRRITEIYIVYTICIFTRCCTVYKCVLSLTYGLADVKQNQNQSSRTDYYWSLISIFLNLIIIFESLFKASFGFHQYQLQIDMKENHTV